MQTLKKTRRKHKTKTERNRKTTEQLKGKRKNNRNTGFPAHEPPRKINISKGLAGRFLFFYVVFYVFLRVLFFCLICCFYVCICVFFDCKCKSLKRLGENIKQTTKINRNKYNNYKKNIKQQKYRISSPQTSANKYLSGSGWEISVFYFFFFFFFSFMFFFLFFFGCFCVVLIFFLFFSFLFLYVFFRL